MVVENRRKRKRVCCCDGKRKKVKRMMPIIVVFAAVTLLSCTTTSIGQTNAKTAATALAFIGSSRGVDIRRSSLSTTLAGDGRLPDRRDYQKTNQRQQTHFWTSSQRLRRDDGGGELYTTRLFALKDPKSIPLPALDGDNENNNEKDNTPKSVVTTTKLQQQLQKSLRIVNPIGNKLPTPPNVPPSIDIIDMQQTTILKIPKSKRTMNRLKTKKNLFRDIITQLRWTDNDGNKKSDVALTAAATSSGVDVSMAKASKDDCCDNNNNSSKGQDKEQLQVYRLDLSKITRKARSILTDSVEKRNGVSTTNNAQSNVVVDNSNAIAPILSTAAAASSSLSSALTQDKKSSSSTSPLEGLQQPVVDSLDLEDDASISTIKKSDTSMEGSTSVGTRLESDDGTRLESDDDDDDLSESASYSYELDLDSYYQAIQDSLNEEELGDDEEMLKRTADKEPALHKEEEAEEEVELLVDSIMREIIENSDSDILFANDEDDIVVVDADDRGDVFEEVQSQLSKNAISSSAALSSSLENISKLVNNANVNIVETVTSTTANINKTLQDKAAAAASSVKKQQSLLQSAISSMSSTVSSSIDSFAKIIGEATPNILATASSTINKLKEDTSMELVQQRASEYVSPQLNVVKSRLDDWQRQFPMKKIDPEDDVVDPRFHFVSVKETGNTIRESSPPRISSVKSVKSKNNVPTNPDEAFLTLEVQKDVPGYIIQGSAISSLITMAVLTQQLEIDLTGLIVVAPAIASYLSITRGATGNATRYIGGLTWNATETIAEAVQEVVVPVVRTVVKNAYDNIVTSISKARQSLPTSIPSDVPETISYLPLTTSETSVQVPEVESDRVEIAIVSPMKDELDYIKSGSREEGGNSVSSDMDIGALIEGEAEHEMKDGVPDVVYASKRNLVFYGDDKNEVLSRMKRMEYRMMLESTARRLDFEMAAETLSSVDTAKNVLPSLAKEVGSTGMDFPNDLPAVFTDDLKIISPTDVISVRSIESQKTVADAPVFDRVTSDIFDDNQEQILARMKRMEYRLKLESRARNLASEATEIPASVDEVDKPLSRPIKAERSAIVEQISVEDPVAGDAYVLSDAGPKTGVIDPVDEETSYGSAIPIMVASGVMSRTKVTPEPLQQIVTRMKLMEYRLLLDSKKLQEAAVVEESPGDKMETNVEEPKESGLNLETEFEAIDDSIPLEQVSSTSEETKTLGHPTPSVINSPQNKQQQQPLQHQRTRHMNQMKLLQYRLNLEQQARLKRPLIQILDLAKERPAKKERRIMLDEDDLDGDRAIRQRPEGGASSKVDKTVRQATPQPLIQTPTLPSTPLKGSVDVGTWYSVSPMLDVMRERERIISEVRDVDAKRLMKEVSMLNGKKNGKPTMVALNTVSPVNVGSNIVMNATAEPGNKNLEASSGEAKKKNRDAKTTAARSKKKSAGAKRKRQG